MTSMLLMLIGLQGQGPVVKPKQPGETPAAARPAAASIDRVRVVRIWKAGPETARLDLAADTTVMTPKDIVVAGMGEILVLQVQDLASLVRRSRCKSVDDKDVGDCEPAAIRLYLDGREIPKLAVETMADAPGQPFGTVQFHLERSSESSETWADLLGAPSLGSFYQVPMRVSLGLQGKYPVPSAVTGERFRFQRLRELPFKIWTAVFGVGLLLFLRYAYSSDLLRDLGPPPKDGRRPYSLGRCQMAWWFILVVGGFAFIFLVTGSWNILTPATLGLLGISAGTFLGSAAIDAGHLSEAQSNQQSITARQAQLNAEAKELKAQLAAAATSDVAKVEMQKRLVANQAELSGLESQQPRAEAAAMPARGQWFLKDILGDGTGQSFHRLQMLVWSIVLGVLFINQVWHRLAMPDFDGTLLGLMGISNGTYLGFKFPEERNSSIQSANAHNAGTP